MGRKEKLLKKFLERPESLRYRQVKLILLWLGVKKVPAKGSHVRFIREDCNVDISIPVHNNDCFKFYKKKIAKIIKEKFL
jgi:predicted RNA binding protein YcfA (HicA-like mRNA interferase family)